MTDLPETAEYVAETKTNLECIVVTLDIIYIVCVTVVVNHPRPENAHCSRRKKKSNRSAVRHIAFAGRICTVTLLYNLHLTPSQRLCHRLYRCIS